MALPIWGKFFQKVYADPSLKITKNGFVKPANMGNIELDCSVYDAQTEKDIPIDDLDFDSGDK